jgi:hypothetical protein
MSKKRHEVGETSNRLTSSPPSSSAPNGLRSDGLVTSSHYSSSSPFDGSTSLRHSPSPDVDFVAGFIIVRRVYVSSLFGITGRVNIFAIFVFAVFID